MNETKQLLVEAEISAKQAIYHGPVTHKYKENPDIGKLMNFPSSVNYRNFIPLKKLKKEYTVSLQKAYFENIFKTYPDMSFKDICRIWKCTNKTIKEYFEKIGISMPLKTWKRPNKSAIIEFCKNAGIETPAFYTKENKPRRRKKTVVVAVETVSTPAVVATTSDDDFSISLIATINCKATKNNLTKIIAILDNGVNSVVIKSDSVNMLITSNIAEKVTAAFTLLEESGQVINLEITKA